MFSHLFRNFAVLTKHGVCHTDHISVKFPYWGINKKQIMGNKLSYMIYTHIIVVLNVKKTFRPRNFLNNCHRRLSMCVLCCIFFIV